MSPHQLAAAPAPLSPSGGAGAAATAVDRVDYDLARIDRVEAAARGARLHPAARETCVHCLQPISAHEYVRAVLVGARTEPRLLGFVHVELCSPKLCDEVTHFAEYVALGARVVDLG